MRMDGKVHRYRRFIIVDIEKPIFESGEYSRVRVDEKYVKEARSTGRFLVVRVPRGEVVYLPKALTKVAKKVKEVFLYPNSPLSMYELDIPHGMKKEEDYYAWS